ncbi:MAG: type II 3-dehydroquinate dehydratase [Pseudomonadota bacterium]
MKKSILLINGPNLNLLGTREPETYGSQTLGDVEALCKEHAQSKGMALECMQSNHEGMIVDAIQQAKDVYTHLVMNPGAYTHTSIAIRDAILGTDARVYEVHISNIHEREEFRHHSYISDIAKGVFLGMGIPGYIAAIDAIAEE